MDRMLRLRVGEGGERTFLVMDGSREAAGLGVDASLPTGQVRVQIEQNEPTYDIIHPVAWDKIHVPARLPEFALLYHGSLALRSAESRSSCEELRKNASNGTTTIFVDVNLRSPWWKARPGMPSLLTLYC